MAKGSTQSYGGWEPRTCARCGGKIVKSSRTLAPRYLHLMFSRFGAGGKPYSIHMRGCPPNEPDATS